MTIKCLHDAYGKKIWQHCVLVFTRSNAARELFESDAVDKYKRYISEYAQLFETELLKLKVRNVNVATIFNKNDSTTIVAIPAGKNISDPVLPGIDTDWKDVILDEMAKRNPAILKYRFQTKRQFAVKTLTGAGLGAIAGAPGMIVGAVAAASISKIKVIKKKRKAKKSAKMMAVESDEEEEDEKGEEGERQMDRQEKEHTCM